MIKLQRLKQKKENSRGCTRSITWYRVFKDIWFHFNNIFLKDVNIREYIKQTAVWFVSSLSTNKNVDTGRNLNGRLEC